MKLLGKVMISENKNVFIVFSGVSSDYFKKWARLCKIKSTGYYLNSPIISVNSMYIQYLENGEIVVAEVESNFTKEKYAFASVSKVYHIAELNWGKPKKIGGVK